MVLADPWVVKPRVVMVNKAVDFTDVNRALKLQNEGNGRLW